MNRNRLAARASAALIAAAAGDALGWPQEPRGGLIGGDKARATREPRPAFDAWQRRGGSRFLPFIDPVAAGSYSDDTQLLLAVARSLLAGDDWRFHFTRMELPAWPVYQRGGGRAVLRASNVWARNSVPWRSGGATTDAAVREYQKAGANGVAMRIAPHVIWGVALSQEVGETLRQVFLDGITTHGHPRALVGAMTYAASLDFAFRASDVMSPRDLLAQARRGLVPASEVMPWLPEGFFADMPRQEFQSEWTQTLQEMDDLLDVVGRSLDRGSLSRTTGTMRDLGALDKATNGAGTVSAAAAIFVAARSGTRPLSGLVQAAFETESDTDTIASMTGALLGAIHGADWLGTLEKVQDSGYLRDLGHALALGTKSRGVHSTRPSPSALQRELEDRQTHRGVFVDGRRYLIRERQQLATGPAWVQRMWLELEDGQTVCVDYVHRNEPRTKRTAPPANGQLLAPDADRGALGPSVPTQMRAVVGSIDLEGVYKFYSALFGQVRSIENNTFRLNETISFERQRASEIPGSVKLEFVVDDLDGLIDSIPTLDVVKRERSSATVRDPDGRLVVLYGRNSFLSKAR